MAVFTGNGSSSSPSITFSSDTNTGIFRASEDTLAFTTNGAERARITSLGRLLLGTTQASANLRDIQTTIDRAPGFQIQDSGGIKSGIGLISWNSDLGGFYAPHLWFAKSNSSDNEVGTNTLVTNGTDLGAIAFAGNDGTTFLNAATIVAEVQGTAAPNVMPGRLVFSTTNSVSSAPTEAMRINPEQELLIGYTTDNGAFKLQVNSQIFATSATVATSDGRYKDNVAPLSGCLDLVKALRPVSFTWKPQENIVRIDDNGNDVLVREGHNFPEGTQVGFIAQDVQEVLSDKPWLNSIIKNNVRSAVFDNEGNELAPEEQFFGIAEGNLISVLTNALQEAIAEISALSDRVSALESL